MALALCLTLLPTAALADELGSVDGASTVETADSGSTPAAGETGGETEAEPDAEANADAEAEAKAKAEAEAEEKAEAKAKADAEAAAAVQAQIDALPAVGALRGMNDGALDAAYMDTQAAYDAYEALTAEQQAQITGAERFEDLFNWFNGQIALLDGDVTIYPDDVNANGDIIPYTDFSRTGPLLTGTETTLSGQYYVVQGTVTIDGDLTVDGSQDGGLVLCQGAKLTVEGALICSGSYSIYGQSDSGANSGRLVIKNSLNENGGAAIRSDSTYPPSLGIYSGELEIHSGNSDKLVDGVKLSSTSHIHQGTLDGTAVSPEVWGAVSLKGGTLTLAYCQHEHSADQELIPDSGGAAHHRHCKACGFDWASEACDFDNPDHYVPNPKDKANTHLPVCECGNVSTTPAKHEPFAIPTDDGKGHTQRCQYCLYTSTENNPVEEHHYTADGECENCGFKPAARDAAGNLYESVGDALKAAEDGSWVMLETHAEDGGKELREEIEFNYPGKTVELKMNGYTLTNSGNPTLTVENGTLKITGDATINQTGTFSDQAAPAVKVTGGTLIFDGKLTATGASGKPAVEVTSGTLRLKAGDVLNGGVSVEGSTTYANVNALLGENLAFAKVGESSAIVKGDVTSISENVTVVAHTHDFKLNSDGKYVCACGYVCPHDKFENGVCKICGNGCAHTNVDENGLCRNCKTQMTVEIVASDSTVTYSTDFKSAMRNATNGTKITLLADVSISRRTGISGDDTTVTLNLNGHKITSGYLDVGDKDTNGTYTTCTLKIIGKGSYEPPVYSGIITVNMKATLDLSEWEGGTISEISISDSSDYEAATREAAVIVGPKAGTIGKLAFGNNQLGELKKTKLSGGSFNEIWVAGFGPVKLGELLADGYAYQNADGSYVKYETTLQGASIYNVKVVKCPHAKINEDGHCAYCNATDFVAQVTAADGSSSAYTDIAAAIAAADGGTLKLLANAGEITISSPLKLDLNGKTAAKLTVTGDVTLASLLPEGYAFKSGSTWISDLTGTELTNVSMAKIPIKSMNYPTEMSMTYGGTGTLLVKVENESGTGAVSFQWYKVEDGNETAVGSATAKNQFDLSALKLPAGQHTFRFSATCDGYKKMSQDIVVTVQKANIGSNRIMPPTAQENLTYTGQPQALITAGSVTSGGTMQYSLTENGTYSQNSPVGTDAGTYTVWYRVIGDANHNDTAPASVAVRIGTKPLTITGVAAASKPYDGTTDAGTPSVTFDGVTLNRDTDYTVTASFDDSSVGSGKNVTATVTLMEQAAKNYTLEQSSFPTTASITKAAAPDFTKETALVIVNGHEKTYTVTLPALPTLETPKEYGAPTYELGDIKLNDGYYTSGAKVENGALTLPIQKNDVETTGPVGTVTVVIKSTNYENITLTVNVDATNKLVPTVTAPTANALTYNGAEQALVTAGQTTGGTMLYRLGDSEWSEQLPTAKNAGKYTVWYQVQGDAEYADVAEQSLTVTAAKKAVTVTALDKNAHTGSTAPDLSSPEADKNYKVEGLLGADTLSGTVTLTYAQTPDMSKPGKTAINIAGTLSNDNYEITYVPGTLTVSNQPSSGGGSSSGGSSSSDRDTSSSGTVKTETTKNNDGSVTKTETKKDGTKIQTTTGKDGSVTKTETKKDGSSVTENKAADGSTGTVKTDKNGNAEAETKVSAKAVEDAKKSGEAVKAPVEVEASRDSSTAPTVKVELPKNSGDTKVEIPVSNVKPGTVAVLVHADGTEEIVKNSLPTEDGIQLTINGGATVKIVDNSKGFIDTQDHWAKDAIDFVSARGLVNGMSATIYAPNNSTTRAQLWTILARQADTDLTGGSVWYEKAQNWAKTKGVSDGANPNAAINRAQMVTMLYRAAGSPEVSITTTFTDVPADSYYAKAVAWAVENGITTGVGGGRFDPNSTCTRGQIATFLYRYMK